jgi:hypothetical protein
MPYRHGSRASWKWIWSVAAKQRRIFFVLCRPYITERSLEAWAETGLAERCHSVALRTISFRARALMLELFLRRASVFGTG